MFTVKSLEVQYASPLPDKKANITLNVALIWWQQHRAHHQKVQYQLYRRKWICNISMQLRPILLDSMISERLVTVSVFSNAKKTPARTQYKWQHQIQITIVIDPVKFSDQSETKESKNKLNCHCLLIKCMNWEARNFFLQIYFIQGTIKNKKKGSLQGDRSRGMYRLGYVFGAGHSARPTKNWATYISVSINGNSIYISIKLVTKDWITSRILNHLSSTTPRAIISTYQMGIQEEKHSHPLRKQEILHLIRKLKCWQK